MAVHVGPLTEHFCPICQAEGAPNPQPAVIETYFSPGCTWCGEPIVPPQRWLLCSKPSTAPTAYHHDCYIFGVIPAEQDQAKRRHREEMAAAQEIRR